MTHGRVETVPPHGDVVRADIRRPSRSDPPTAVVVAHGFKGFKDWGFFPYLCERLAGDGHLVVSFNFSLNGTGPSLVDFSDLDAFGRNTVSREIEDLNWVVDRTLAGEWSGTPPVALGLLGHSRGGGVGIVTASAHSGVSALVTWAAVSTFHRWREEDVREWRTRGVTWVVNARTGQRMPVYRTVWDDLRRNSAKLDILGAAARVRRPWLIVHGEEDATVPVGEAHRLADAGPRARLEVIAGSGHTFECGHPLAETTRGLEAAVEATLRHFRESL